MRIICPKEKARSRNTRLRAHIPSKSVANGFFYPGFGESREKIYFASIFTIAVMFQHRRESVLSRAIVTV